MPHGAKLTSIDAVQAMSAAMESFRLEASAALEDLEMEIRRALEWIQNDRREHWSSQVKRGWERLAEARVQLQQAMTFRRIGSHDPSCIDEKKALERSKRRLDLAEEKVETVRHWTHAIERAVHEYRGSRGQVSSWLETEHPKAMSVLKRMAAALERYVGTEMPEEVQQQLATTFQEAEPQNATPQEDAPCDTGT
jgi:hypothetical protein